MCVKRSRGHGFSLVEVIIAIVIVAISVLGVMSVFVVTTQHSADPMARQQAQLIAEAYLDEILIKRFYDPNTNDVCPANEGARNLYDNACDYHNLNQAPTDQGGLGFGFSGYNVAVTVDNGTGVSLNGVTNTLGPTVTRVLLITVTVTGPNNTTVVLNGYRTNYECNASGDPECKP